MLMEVHHSILKCSNTSRVLGLNLIYRGILGSQVWEKVAVVLDDHDQRSNEIQHSDWSIATQTTPISA
jgi:hypothetical protein